MQAKASRPFLKWSQPANILRKGKALKHWRDQHHLALQIFYMHHGFLGIELLSYINLPSFLPRLHANEMRSLRALLRYQYVSPDHLQEFQ